MTVNKADGSQQHFVAPYTSTAQLLRLGTSRFNVTAGETRNNYVSSQAKLMQDTYPLGLTNDFTGYMGSQLSDDYKSALAGLAFSTPIVRPCFWRDPSKDRPAQR